MNAKASIAFLKEAAAYFSKQPTDGEDSKHWANVLNSENCTHAAEVIASQASRIAELEKALSALLVQALQSELNTPAHEWGHEAIQSAIAALPNFGKPVLSTQAAE